MSSSCYGPEEAYLALGGHNHLAIILAVAAAATVAIIAASYSQIIGLFPGGGGGYIVATRLLSPVAGVISGCALVVDYILTIAISVSSGVDALLSFSSRADSPFKVTLCLCAIVSSDTEPPRLEGIGQDPDPHLPPLRSHPRHSRDRLPGRSRRRPARGGGGIGARGPGLVRSIGLFATLFVFLRAFSLGAGTYTGIEAVSNGLPVLREPRVRTGRRTMLYMAISLGLTAGGILIAYRLFGIEHRPGQTLNATLLHRFADGWNGGPVPLGPLLVSSRSWPKEPCCSWPRRPDSWTARGYLPPWRWIAGCRIDSRT